MNKNKISPPIAYLEKTKKNRDEPSSRAIFAEFGTKAKKKDDNKTIKIPVFIILLDYLNSACANLPACSLIGR